MLEQVRKGPHFPQVPFWKAASASSAGWSSVRLHCAGEIGSISSASHSARPFQQAYVASLPCAPEKTTFKEPSGPEAGTKGPCSRLRFLAGSSTTRRRSKGLQEERACDSSQRSQQQRQ